MTRYAYDVETQKQKTKRVRFFYSKHTKKNVHFLMHVLEKVNVEKDKSHIKKRMKFMVQSSTSLPIITQKTYPDVDLLKEGIENTAYTDAGSTWNGLGTAFQPYAHYATQEQQKTMSMCCVTALLMMLHVVHA